MRGCDAAPQAGATLTTAACAARRSPLSRRSPAVAVPVVLTKCSRRPRTRRDILYWTQSASPTQTGDEVDRLRL
jgi:hypothetical protein